jgi:prepilin-type N-terminal cleavage/methylation domain-containing protein
VRPAAWDRARTGRDGFTLLELIVVIALLVALGGLALPGLLSRVAGSTQGAVRTRLEAAGAICRAEAQRSGRTIELAARVVEGRVLVVGRRAVEEETDERDSGDVLLELPTGYTVSRTRPGDEGSRAESDPEIPGLGGDGGVVIAVFGPDGTAAPGGARFVIVGTDAMEVRIARWTGALTLSEPLSPQEPAEADEVEPDFPPEVGVAPTAAGPKGKEGSR